MSLNSAACFTFEASLARRLILFVLGIDTYIKPTCHPPIMIFGLMVANNRAAEERVLVFID